MPENESRIRLFVDAPLMQDATVTLTGAQAHYLGHVMRVREGTDIAAFNGIDGEWHMRVTTLSRRLVALDCIAQSAPQIAPPDLWLLFAPIKKTRTDFIVEKAVELGVSHLQPVFTEYTNSERVNVDRLQAHAVEAAEQCGARVVPKIAAPAKLPVILSDWPAERRLLFCDEAGDGTKFSDAASSEPTAILIGPEGGFSATERARLIAMDQTTPVSLGPRILRADTAAAAALTLWQAKAGDWQ